MFKRVFGIIFCFVVFSLFSSADAHSTFTWFGLRKDNTEIFINTGTAHEPDCPPHKPHPKKHKPKPPKHEPHKKGPKHHKCFWWCK